MAAAAEGESHFVKGDKVEVSSPAGLFPATVLRRHSGKLKVEYDTLSPPEKPHKRLKEHVSPARVRPQLPAELHRRFKGEDRVDALHGGAWRAGEVVEVLENSRYLVKLGLGGGEEKSVECDLWNLRIHRDWDDGSWVPPLDEQVKSSESDENLRKLKLRITFSARAFNLKFGRGTMVEVKSENDDNHVSWFNAVIINSIGNEKFLVEYQTPRVDKKTKVRFESVDASYIRPCPPEIERLDQYTQFQEVDAFYDGGWRVGRITKVLADDKYILCGGGKNDILIVEHSKLRTHQDWVDDKWVVASKGSPELELKSSEGGTKLKTNSREMKGTKLETRSNKRPLGTKLSKGTLVEVKSDEEGYHGSWYTAVVVDLVEKDMYLIEYETLKTEDESELLKEKVNASSLRPRPPHIGRLDRFRHFEKVDAWYNDGWWVGIVSRYLGDLNYGVFFWTTNEELQFGHYTLRPHQEWIDGKFIPDFLRKPSPSPAKPRPGNSKRGIGYIPVYAKSFLAGMKVEVRSDEEGYSGTWYPAVIIASKGSGKFLVEYRTLIADDKMKLLREDEGELLREDVDCCFMRPSPPVIQRPDPFKPIEEVDAWYSNAWWRGCVCKVLQGSKYTVRIKSSSEVLEFPHSDLRHCKVWTGQKWVNPSTGKH